MNPLDTGEPFQFEAMNPNTRASKTKDGSKYFLTVELDQPDWQMFMDANTAGMVLEMQGRVVADNSKSAEQIRIEMLEKNKLSFTEKPKGGPISKNAGMLCGEIEANYFAIDKGFADMKEMIYGRCKIESRAELDHNPDAAFRYKMVKSEYITSCEAGER